MEYWGFDFNLLFAKERESLAEMVVADGKATLSWVNKAAIRSHQGRPVRSQRYEVRWNCGGKWCWCRWWCQILLPVHSLHARQRLLYVKVYGLAVREVVLFYLREGGRIIKYDILHWVLLVSQMAFDNGKLS